MRSYKKASSSNDAEFPIDDEGQENRSEEELPTETDGAIQTDGNTLFKINDQGTQNWDERFNYKVKALMGLYDPQDSNVDNEQQDGNILNAMVKFPAQYDFNVVGKTNGEEALREEFVQQVKKIFTESNSDTKISNEDEGTQYYIKQRGEKFTKVTVVTRVESAAVVSNIYEQLSLIENAVMRF